MNESIIYRHPEWKRLYDSVVPLLVVGRLFSYEELSALMGLDCQSASGRKQFYRCAKAIAEDHQMQFECVLTKGYRVVEHAENSGRMCNRMGRARRRIKAAAFIGIHTKLEELTIEQRRANADILVRLGRIESTLGTEQKETRAQIVAAEPKRLPHPLRTN